MFQRIATFFACVLTPISVGFLSSLFTMSSIRGWYTTIDKPFFTPPNWLFGPVWSMLYSLMGLALYLVWQKKHHEYREQAIVFFAVQLFLNALWSPVFFTLHYIGAAFGLIILLLGCIGVTIYFFARVDRRAAWLLVPYLLWTTYATVLNGAIWQLNM